jgi:heat shock protein HslJ
MRRARAFGFALAAALPLATLSLSACGGSGISLDEPIEGPSWRLVLLGDQPVLPGEDPMRNPQLQFNGASGRLSGSGGCNRLSAAYSRSHSQLRINQIAATQMACGEPARNQLESQFFQALQGTASYRLQGPGRLALLDAGSHTLAVFEAGR